MLSLLSSRSADAGVLFRAGKDHPKIRMTRGPPILLLPATVSAAKKTNSYQMRKFLHSANPISTYNFSNIIIINLLD